MDKASEVIIYIDSCDIINCCDGNNGLLEKAVFEAKIYPSIFIPFSATHIKEVVGNKNLHFQIQRLTYLAGFTTCLYLCNDIHGISWRTENPFNVFKTINEVSAPNEFLQSLVPYELIKNIRDTTKFNPQYMNNIKPKDAISEINEILKEIAKTNEEYTYTPIEDMLKMLKEINIANNRQLWKDMGADPGVLDSIDYEAFMLFSLFDSLGFWSDSKNVYNKGSGFGDSQHASVGIKAHYLISSDKRFRMKTKAVYSFLNIPTKVLDPDEAVELFNALISENKMREGG
jgi:hypothetical protein